MKWLIAYLIHKQLMIPNVSHIYATSSDMSMVTMCSYPQSQHAFPNWKCMLSCCSNLPCIDITHQELDRHNSNTSSSICFNIYHLITCCTVHGILSLHENEICCLYLQDLDYVPPEKYTRKELVLMETSIYDFHTSF